MMNATVRPPHSDHPHYRNETVSEFMARGGVVKKCSANTAHNTALSTIYTDGVAIPIHGNFAPESDETYSTSAGEYDAAQYRREDDGDASIMIGDWKDYERTITQPLQTTAMAQSRLDRSMGTE